MPLFLRFYHNAGIAVIYDIRCEMFIGALSFLFGLGTQYAFIYWVFFICVSPLTVAVESFVILDYWKSGIFRKWLRNSLREAVQFVKYSHRFLHI